MSVAFAGNTNELTRSNDLNTAIMRGDREKDRKRGRKRDLFLRHLPPARSSEGEMSHNYLRAHQTTHTHTHTHTQEEREKGEILK